MLALQLDSATNNTSLAPAIEIIGSGEVLLFLGDAQVGSWTSWADLWWQAADGQVLIDDLLANTVLYKVGHHGSHNATLRSEGLLKMTHPRLAAMIPVDRTMARRRAGRCHIRTCTSICRHRLGEE
ncbi:MAG: hypothetical protein ACR2HJ_10425 [Fimbriimonadales bacterium]